jgi:glycosyltransferase involved in cell wall biosynthesis
MDGELGIVVTARNEADRLGETLAALRDAFPGARVVVADDASDDGTAEVARAAGVEVVSAERRLGKGGVATMGAERLRGHTLVLCDGDLGASAAHLPALVDALREGDLAIAVFARSVGGGFGIALGFAGRVIRRLTGLELRAPISGQRALAPPVVDAVLPFARGFGMEIGMTVDAHRAGYRIVEVELPLEHRATGRDAAGFIHRARQLADFTRVYASRRGGGKRA